MRIRELAGRLIALHEVPGPSAPGKMYRYEERRYAPPLDEFENPIGSGTTEIHLMEFSIVRETPRGAWVSYYGSEPRFVRNEARKRYACRTKEAALASFIARKRRQAEILERQLSGVRALIYMAEHNGAPMPCVLPDLELDALERG